MTRTVLSKHATYQAAKAAKDAIISDAQLQIRRISDGFVVVERR